MYLSLVRSAVSEQIYRHVPLVIVLLSKRYASPKGNTGAYDSVPAKEALAKHMHRASLSE